MEHAFTRRVTLTLGTGMATLLAGCGHLAEPLHTPTQSGSRGPLIDAHCHLFNASDLSAIRFLKIVFIGLHPPSSNKLLGVEDPDIVDALLALFVVVFAGRAPSAQAEINHLRNFGDAELASVAALNASNDAIENDLASFLRAPPQKLGLRPTEVIAQARVRSAILVAGGQRAGSNSLKSMSQDTAMSIAKGALNSKFDIGTYLRWFRLFSRFRFQLVDELTSYHRTQGYEPALLTPAMVDYARWLLETPKSPLGEQVDVFTEIAKRPGKTAVHGYVAYDPLHQVYLEMDRKPKSMSNAQWALEKSETPLQIVERALTSGGFLGVKLYPPMGFRATHNADLPALDFPDQVTDDLGLDSRELGLKLDGALAKLYDLCVRPDIDAPIMAHGGEGNEANKDYGKRADPYYWWDVAKNWPKLRISLAHFGGFKYQTAGPAGPQPPPLNKAWEMVIGRFVAANPGHPLFADLSYLSEVFNASASVKAKHAAYFKAYAQLDPKFEHIIFGTDWIMLGNINGSDSYAGQIGDFLRNDCRLNDDQFANVMWRNAVRFLGLRPGSSTRARLDRFYLSHGLDKSRLSAFDLA